MATGSNRRLIYNTREQVLSTDMNRSLAFIAATLDETFRQQHVEGSYAGFLAPVNGTGVNIFGFTEDHSVTEAPTFGVVYGGFACHPLDNTMTINIDPGVALVVDPDPSPSPDDSVAKLISDPGGSVTVTNNGAGSIRIDILEASRQDVITETDSRNQYNTVTGTFTPVNFSKVGIGQFQYRVRAGTPGGGVPAAAQGWLPLLVIAVPPGASQLNGCNFWDVRPILSARAKPSNTPNHGSAHFKWCRGAASCTGANTATDILFEGECEVVDNFGYKLGGFLQGRDASGGNIISTVDLSSTANQESGFSAVNLTPYFVYIATPIATAANGGYIPLIGPRWVAYGRANNGALQPSEPSGIVLVSSKFPKEDGTAVLSAPTSSGLSCQLLGYCIASGWTHVSQQGFVINGNQNTFNDNQPLAVGSFHVSAANTVSANTNFVLQPDTHFPRNAKAVLVIPNVSWTGASANTLLSAAVSFTSQKSSATYNLSLPGCGESIWSGAGGAGGWSPSPMKLPLETFWKTGEANVIVTVNVFGTTAAGGNLIIVGYEF